MFSANPDGVAAFRQYVVDYLFMANLGGPVYNPHGLHCHLH